MSGNLTRRALLQSSIAASVLKAGAQTTAASDRVRIGLIGCGGISVADSNAFLAHPECEIAAVCDIDDEHIKETLDRMEKLGRARPDAVKDFRRILDRKDIDVCLVCTPDHWHALPTIGAFQAGKDVYVEKPLATSIAEGRAMRDAARRYGRVCQMGTHWRSGQHYAEAIEMVRGGKLGRVRQVRCWAYLDWVHAIGNPANEPVPAGIDYDMWLGPSPARPFNKNRFHFNFRWFWDYAGGLQTDWGVHLINIALWGMGLDWPMNAVSTGGKRVFEDNSETPDTQMTLYEFPSYTLIWEHQAGNGLGPDRREHGVMFTGTDASLVVDASGWELFAEPAKRGAVIEMKRQIAATEKIRAQHARNFLDCVKSRQAPVENLDVGHHVTAVAHLGNVALRSKSRVEWDAAAERVVNNPAADALTGRSYRAPWKLA